MRREYYRSPSGAFFESLSNHVRLVLSAAPIEAKNRNEEYIGTEHILLALVRDGTGIGANVLTASGINLANVEAEVYKLTKGGSRPVTSDVTNASPRASRVITNAVDEARALNHQQVNTGHLLLGLLDERDGVAAQVLMNLRAKLDVLRQNTMDALQG